MDVNQTAGIINAVDDGWTILAVAVPTRGLRIVTDTTERKFRVEQLMPGESMRWRPIALHHGDVAWESFGPAMDDMIQKQARLKEKIKLAQHERNMAQLKAQQAIS